MHLQLWSLGGALVSNVKCLRVVGENVSGMPIFYLLVQDGEVGFDYPLHMVVADKRIESCEDWQMGDIVYTPSNRSQSKVSHYWWMDFRA